MADRPALRRTLREQTRSLGLYKLNPRRRVWESPRRRTSLRDAIGEPLCSRDFQSP
ncbi:hypothetical protein [aff. Roholtiella sp. LEGE 12411]|uniref:hypothetical protein n=1 Tax=aff. Roholtiella sp. LEGE 12411 TaxID=1828822 RepID=UPI001881578F|nr:hypothetical protein [aff. Roholtiella sp. LEGE 12411]